MMGKKLEPQSVVCMWVGTGWEHPPLTSSEQHCAVKLLMSSCFNLSVKEWAFCFVWSHMNTLQTIKVIEISNPNDPEKGITEQVFCLTSVVPTANKWSHVFYTQMTRDQTHRGAFKEKLTSVQSVNGINLPPLLRAARHFQALISAGIFWAADVSLHPAHHQECLGDRGAAHQNAIRTLLATRWTHAQNASCGSCSVPLNSSSFLPSVCVFLMLNH